MTPTPDIRVTDNKARLTLPKSFANSTVLVEVVSENEVVIRKAKVVPLAESEDLPSLFLAVLDNPPPPNAALRKLMSPQG